MYYWLRTYLLERRDVANKSELGRMAMAQQRTQPNVPTSSAGSLGLVDGNARAQSQSGGILPSNNHIHQGTQSGGAGSQEGGNSHGQEPDRPTAGESNVHTANDQPLQQSSSTVGEGVQNVMRRNGALSLVASAASAFDAAKDIMETLRSKHANLASELEVTNFVSINKFETGEL